MKKRYMFLLAILFTIMFCSINVFAGEIINHGTGDHRFRFDFDANGYPVTSVKVNGVEWVKDGEDVHEYLTNDNIYTIVVLAGKSGDSFPQVMTPGGYDEYGTYDGRPNPNDNQNVVGDEFIFTLTLTNYNDDWDNDFEMFGVRMEDGPEPTIPFHDEECDITISISGEELEYHYVEDKPNEADVTYFKFGINSQHSDDIVPFTFGNAKYTYIDGKEPPKNVSKAETKEPIHYRYRYNDSGYVEFCVNGGGTDEYTKIEINGVDYSNQAPHTQKEVFERFGGGASSQFCIQNVPYNAFGYNVVVEGRQVSDDKKVAGFSWSYLSHDRSPDVPIEEEGDFAHGRLEFVHAKYVDEDNQVYEFSSYQAYNNGRYHETGEIFQWANGDKNYPEEDRRYAWGNILAPYGTEITVRIVPDAGYQLTSMTTSEHGFQATDEPGVYKIALTRENLQFNDDGFRLEPVFSKIGSEVQATSNKIKGGTIQTQEVVENGSLKLAVTDANVSNERQNAFINKANEQGFTVSNIVDISLYNSIYKGGKKDNNGYYLSWDNEVNNLAHSAKIVLELEEDMRGKEVALVHEEHDGDTVTGYKLVPVNYDEETNSIYFEETNFSNFAIVVRDNNEEKETVQVFFNCTGGSEIEPMEIEKGTKIPVPKNPTNGKRIFVDWYKDEDLTISFDFEEEINENITLYAKWEDDNRNTDYTVSDESGNTISFKEESDHEYHLNIIDYLSFTKEEVMKLGDITSEQYDAIFDGLKEAAKKEGTLISFFEIMVTDEDDRDIHEGPFTIKIKLTSEMKKYNTFKLMYVNEDFSIGEPITLKVEGDYLVGTLEHLSLYTLVGSNVEQVPKTGDNIYTWVGILCISIIGLSIGMISLRKKVK